MDSASSNLDEICPDLMRRACGGWLAAAPRGGRFTFAVTADTADEARDRFRSTIQRWVAILDGAGNSQRALPVPAAPYM